jgi:hypothetical protein
MAHVILELKLVMSALDLAYEAMKPQPHQISGARPREERMLADIRLAALWVEQHGYAVEQVALTIQEAQMIEPYIKP